jgi:phosphohistidine phosphatase
MSRRVDQDARVIWFLRHGDAEDSAPDEARRLTDEGRAQARAAGAALAQHGKPPELCLTSPRVRARETAELACTEISVEIVADDRLGGGDFDPLELAAGLDDVLLVGHEPDFSRAIATLTGESVEMKKGMLAGVESGKLVALIRDR